MTIKLYRAVCKSEGDETLASGALKFTANSLEGKWFAETIGDAVKWGIALSRLGAVRQDRILVIEFPLEVADQFFRLPMLDGIGPARFATASDFDRMISVHEVFP